MKFLREPTVHFLALGLGLFLLFALVGDDESEAVDRIVVSEARVAQLAEIFARTWQRPPTEGELQGLIEGHIKEEIYYREALAMGLDRDDTIVRRRLRQKLEFIADDLLQTVDPTEDQLQSYLDEHPDPFRIPGRFSFRHVYLDRDERGDRLERDAENLLARLNGDGAPADVAALGDAITLPRAFEDATESEVARAFGRRFGAALADLPVGRWAGPVASGYGVHLVLVSDRSPGSIPEFAQVRDAVEREWRDSHRRDAEGAFYESLRGRYEIEIAMPGEVDDDGGTSVAAAAP